LFSGEQIAHTATQRPGVFYKVGVWRRPGAVNPDDKRRCGAMAYWLFKSEPDVFSWEHLKEKGAAGEE
ncbi:MAG: EVE domain-containing protein, partial [Pseudomonadota bacterium]